MRNVKLVVEYDGTDLAGWQRQENGPTVQQHLEDGLAQMVGSHVTVIGASRTDAGVHALGQVANFRTDSDIPAQGFRRGLNSKLPASIAVVWAGDAAESFHSRFDSVGKHYRYQIVCRPDRSPLRRTRTWHVPAVLDVTAIREAAAALVGEHDFSAFRAAGCTAKTATRQVTKITISDVEPDQLQIDVLGNAFLRNMVRIIAGTLVDVGEGRIQSSKITDILSSQDRSLAGRTAPAAGLTLVRAFYM